MPDCVTVLFHACEMDSPGGKSNSSLQSGSGAELEFEIAKRAMKPSCHACCTVNVAVTAAAWAIGFTARPTAVATTADTAT